MFCSVESEELRMEEIEKVSTFLKDGSSYIPSTQHLQAIDNPGRPDRNHAALYPVPFLVQSAQALYCDRPGDPSQRGWTRIIVDECTHASTVCLCAIGRDY